MNTQNKDYYLCLKEPFRHLISKEAYYTHVTARNQQEALNRMAFCLFRDQIERLEMRNKDKSRGELMQIHFHPRFKLITRAKYLSELLTLEKVKKTSKKASKR
jgi:hypothetical protein